MEPKNLMKWLFGPKEPQSTSNPVDSSLSVPQSSHDSTKAPPPRDGAAGAGIGQAESTRLSRLEVEEEDESGRIVEKRETGNDEGDRSQDRDRNDKEDEGNATVDCVHYVGLQYFGVEGSGQAESGSGSLPEEEGVKSDRGVENTERENGGGDRSHDQNRSGKENEDSVKKVDCSDSGWLQYLGVEGSGPPWSGRASLPEEEKDKSERGVEDKEQGNQEGDRSQDRNRTGNEKEENAKNGDCVPYVKTGTCKFGSNCRYNHPVWIIAQPEKGKLKEAEESKQEPGQSGIKAEKVKAKEKNESTEKPSRRKNKRAGKLKMQEKKEPKENPGQTECKAGKVLLKEMEAIENSGQSSKAAKEKVQGKVESKEKPGQTKSKAAKEKVKENVQCKEKPEQTESKGKKTAAKEKMKEKEERKEKQGQTKPKAAKEKQKEKGESKDKRRYIPCMMYSSTGNCKYGKDCIFKHAKIPVPPAPKPPAPKPLASMSPASKPPAPELNFLGLPIRQGMRDCPVYLRTGTCKSDANCKFNHPDPTVEDDPLQYNAGVSASSQSEPYLPVWSSSWASSESAPSLPTVYPTNQAVPPPNIERNGYQFPVYPAPGQNMHTPPPPPPAWIMPRPAMESHVHTNHQQVMYDQFHCGLGYTSEKLGIELKSNCNDPMSLPTQSKKE